MQRPYVQSLCGAGLARDAEPRSSSNTAVVPSQASPQGCACGSVDPDQPVPPHQSIIFPPRRSSHSRRRVFTFLLRIPSAILDGSAFPGSCRHRSIHDHVGPVIPASHRSSGIRCSREDFIADFRCLVLFVKIQLAHLTHAVFVVIDRFRLCCAVRRRDSVMANPHTVGLIVCGQAWQPKKIQTSGAWRDPNEGLSVTKCIIPEASLMNELQDLLDNNERWADARQTGRSRIN